MKVYSLSLSILVGVVALSLAIAWVHFTRQWHISYTQPHTPVDIMVVLAGGKGRLSKTLEFFRKGSSKTLYIAGAGTNNLSALFTSDELSNLDMKDIYIEAASSSTLQNAQYLKQYAITHPFQSMILATSTYHMPRALIVFRKMLPSSIDIIPLPLESDNFHMDTWWKKPISLKIAFSEFIKYWGYRLIVFRPI